MNNDHYVRACANFLDRHGIEKPYEFNVLNDKFGSNKERYEVWLVESVHTGLITKDKFTAFRCLLQVREYLGRGDGFFPGPDIADAARALQSRVEEFIPRELFKKG